MGAALGAASGSLFSRVCLPAQPDHTRGVAHAQVGAPPDTYRRQRHLAAANEVVCSQRVLVVQL